MDKLEEANNRLLVRRECLKENTQTYPTKKSIQTIAEIQADIMNMIKAKKKQQIPCLKCGSLCFDKICSSCSAEEASRKNIQYLAESKNTNYNNYLEACGIPKRFSDVQPKDDNRSLFLTGAFGTGKTYLAVAIMKGYIDLLPNTCFVEPFNNVPFFITIPDLLLKIRATFSISSCESEIVDKYANTRLLVLDDLGAEKTTEFSLQTLYIILNRRYNEQLQTIITSNLTIDEIRDKIGDRIASRVVGMCKIMKLTGRDKRLSAT